jgi:acyl-CoA thioester hydrolase
MQRIKLTLPDQFSFFTTLQIRITDLNYGGHLGNDTLLTLLHEARVQFLNHYKYTELHFENVGLIMADVAIEYKQEIKYGATIKIYVSAVDFDKIGFDIYYKVTLLKDDGETLAAKAKTGMICYDYNIGKKVSVPIEAVTKLQPAFN